MASRINVDSDDEDLLRPSIAVKTRIITPDMVDDVLAVCPHASREAIKRDLYQTHSVSTTINRILDGEVALDFTTSGLDNPSSTKNKIPVYSNSDSGSMGVMKVDKAACSDMKKCLTSTDIDTDTDDSDVVEFHMKCEKMQTSVLRRTSEIQDISFPDETCEKMEVDQDENDDVVLLDFEEKKQTKKKESFSTSDIIDLSFVADDYCHSKDAYSNLLEGKEKSSESVASYGKSDILDYSGKQQLEKSTEYLTCEIIDLSFEDKDIGPNNQVHTDLFKEKVKNNSDFMCKTSDILDDGIKKHQGENEYSCKKVSEEAVCIGIDSDDNSDTCDARITDVSASESETDDLPIIPVRTHGSSSSQIEKESSHEEYIHDETIPKKKKKGSSEEARRQKEEKKRLKEQEKQKTKEMAERKKMEKQKAMLAKKKQKEADMLNQKSQKKEECMKNMEVCIDPEVLFKGTADVDPIIAKLTSLGVSYTLQTHPIPKCITWKRAIVEYKVGEDLEIKTHKIYSDESKVIMCLEIEAFISLVKDFITARHGSFGSRISIIDSFCSNLADTYSNKTITIVIIGLEKYFRDIKTKQARQFRNAVRGDADTTEKSKSKSRKASQSKPLTMVTKVEVEELLVYLELTSDFKITLCETEQDFAEFVGMFTKALAEAPFKKTQPDVFSFCVDPGKKPPVKVTKEGSGFLKLWQQQLQQYHNVSANMAAAIVSAYPSPQLLVQAYRKCADEKSASLLLKDIVVRRGEGVLATSRRIGPELSRQIYILFNATDGQTLTK